MIRHICQTFEKYWRGEHLMSAYPRRNEILSQQTPKNKYPVFTSEFYSLFFFTWVLTNPKKNKIGVTGENAYFNEEDISTKSWIHSVFFYWNQPTFFEYQYIQTAIKLSNGDSSNIGSNKSNGEVFPISIFQ